MTRRTPQVGRRLRRKARGAAHEASLTDASFHAADAPPNVPELFDADAIGEIASSIEERREEPEDATDAEVFEHLVEGEWRPAEAAALHEEDGLAEALLDEGVPLQADEQDPDEVELEVDERDAGGQEEL